MPKQSSLDQLQGRIRVNAKRGQDDAAELLIYGDIGDSWFGDSVTAKSVVDQLATIDAPAINVRINSYGGSCTDGLAIFNALKRHPAKIHVTVDGIAASVASLIAMAGDTVDMPANALMMIHAPWGSALGNAKDMERFADKLRAHEAAMAEAYSEKSKRPVADILAIFRSYEDTWLSADEALAEGFSDSVNAVSTSASAALRHLETEPGFARFAARMPTGIAAAIRHTPPAATEAAPGEPAMPTDSRGTTVTAAQREEIVAAERERVTRITSIRDQHPANSVLAQVAERALREGMSFEDFGPHALAALGQAAQPLAGYVVAPGTRSDFVQAASDVLVQRAGIRIAKPHAGARDIAGMSIVAIAEACLSRNDLSRGASPATTIRAAMSTSDFPLILENSIRKAMRKGYEDEPATHNAWVRRSTVDDFKPQSRVILGSMPELLQVLEGAEYTNGALDEDKSVPFQVDKYGRIISITWEALVNDDLGALGRIPQGLGQAARRKEADLVYALFAGNGQLMQDAVALFNAAHNNLATSSTALDEAALAKGRLLMRKQTALGGGALNLVPRVLLVPAEFEGQAEKIIAASSVHLANSTATGLEVVTPAWIRGLELVVESRLPDDAAYLLANPDQIDTAELAYLSGDNNERGTDIGGPVVEEENEFRRDVHSWKVRAVMGARFLDWRGVVKLPIG